MSETIETKRKLMVRDLGNPKDVTKRIDMGAGNGGMTFVHPGRMVLGTILGQLSKIRITTNSNGDEVETLMGDFRGLDAEGKLIVKAGREAVLATPNNVAVAAVPAVALETDQLSLPQSWASVVTGPFYQGGEKPIEFAIEVGVIRSQDTSMGWRWALNPIVVPVASNAVARLMDAVGEYHRKVEGMEEESLYGGKNTVAGEAEKKEGKKKAA